MRFSATRWRSAFWGCFVTLVGLATSSLRAATPGPLLASASELPGQKTTLVFGQKIAYYDLGSGPTLVLVHGFASQARFDWGTVLVHLSKHYPLLALYQV